MTHTPDYETPQESLGPPSFSEIHKTCLNKPYDETEPPADPIPFQRDPMIESLVNMLRTLRRKTSEKGQ